MSFQRLLALARSPMGRVTAALGGIAAVALLVEHTGPRTVVDALSAASSLIWAVLLLEGCIMACSGFALRATYGSRRHLVPPWQLVRSSLIAYAVMGLVPAGRTVAEATRGALLSRYVGGPAAATAATRIQGAALLANFGISTIAALVALSVLGPSVLTIAIAGNSLLTLCLGIFILVAARKMGVGAWLDRRAPGMHGFGAAVDDIMRDEPVVPWGAVAWEFAGRLSQLAQNAVLVLAISGRTGIVPALLSEGIHLVGAAVGDLIPAQLGATEANYMLSARALSLTPANAVAVAITAHLAQLSWVLVGSIVPLVWPPPPPSQTPRGSAAAGDEPQEIAQ